MGMSWINPMEISRTAHLLSPTLQSFSSYISGGGRSFIERLAQAQFMAGGAIPQTATVVAEQRRGGLGTN
jgi:hypothetical protein